MTKVLPNIIPIELWLKYYVKFHNYPSISVGIVSLDKIQTNFFGYYDSEDNLLAKVNSKYCIASLTKIYTSIEILKLEEEGKLSIEDKVSKYLNYYPDEETTIKDLLIHAAGLPRDGDFNFWLTEIFPNDSELMESLRNIKIVNKGKYKYSNLGFAILGLILKKFNRNFVQADIQNIRGYGKKVLHDRKVYSFIDHKAFTDSFGLYKNIQEISEFTQKVLKNNLAGLSESSWNKIFSIQFEREQGEDDITIGFEKWKTENVYEAMGYGFGFASSVLIDLDNNVAYTVLSNSGQEDFVAYFTRTIRRFINYFSDENNKINFYSNFNGFYRCKDYDVLLYDCGEKLFVIKPSDETPFHPENFEEYKKTAENKYLISNKKDDVYRDELLSFEFDENGKPTGFKQGGWGFRRIELDL